MVDLLIMFRTLNLYAHHAHNMCYGKNFLEDHAFFAEIYAFADESYDSIIERMIGMDQDVDLKKIISESHELIEEMSDSYMKTCLVMIEITLKGIAEQDKGASPGTKNMLEGIADALEVFVYKIKRKMK